MVPEGWSISKLAERPIRVIDGDRGKNYPSAGDFADTGHCLFLSAKNVTKNGFLFEEKQFVSEEKHRALRKGTLTRGDIVLTTRGTVGNIAYFDDDVPFDVMRINSGMVLVRNEDEQVSVDFLSLLFRSFVVQNQVKRMTFGSAQPQLTVGIINRFKLPLPPLPEQRKIADILSTWDAAIEKTEALLATARTQKRALMQQLLTGKRRFSEFEGQPWQEVRLGEVCDPKQWTTIAGKNMTETGFPVYGANGHIGFFSEYNHEDETIAVGCRGVCGSVHLTPPKSYITGNSMALDQVDPSKAVVRFLFQYLTYFGFRDIVSGSAQPQITGRAIKAYRLSLPPVEEQKRVADLLQAADDEVKWIKTEITKLRTEKKALMQQLLTGKRRVVV